MQPVSSLANPAADLGAFAALCEHPSMFQKGLGGDRRSCRIEAVLGAAGVDLTDPPEAFRPLAMESVRGRS